MSFHRLDMVKELRLLAHGRKLHTPAEAVALWALGHMRALEHGELPENPRDDSRRWLEKLYALKDPRHV